MKVGQYTGETLRKTRPATYRQIIQLLAADVPHSKIAKLCNVHRSSVAAAEKYQAIPIMQRKEQLRDLHLSIATNGAEQIEDALAQGKYTPAQLPTVVGISTDKVVQLSDAQPSKLEITLSAPNILSTMQSLAAQISQACQPLPDIEAEVVPVPALPAPDPA